MTNQILYPPPNDARSPDDAVNARQRRPLTITHSKPISSQTLPTKKLTVTALDKEFCVRLSLLHYLTTNQAATLRSQLAEELTLPFGQKADIRGTQRRLLQLTQAGLVRRIVQPVFPGEGSRQYVYALGEVGAHLVSEQTGVDLDELDWKPKEAEHRLSFDFPQHYLGVADCYLALMRSCLKNDVRLAQWMDDNRLHGHPARVPVELEDGRKQTLSLVPDAVAKIVLPSKKAAWLFLEYDRGGTTILPAHWHRGWRKKWLMYRALPESRALKDHFDADNMVVMVVTSSSARIVNLVKACERYARNDARFWFTTMSDLERDVLTDPIWRVVNKGDGRHPLLPPPLLAP
jgi:hypothetical protein